MSILESILYGLISGVVEFFPISGQATQQILLRMFGVGGREPLRDLVVHLAALAGLILACRGYFSKLLRDHRTAQSLANAAHHRHELRGIYDLRVVKMASVVMLLGMLLGLFVRKWESNLIVIIIFCLINGLIMFLPERLPQGNKDARSMSALESFFVGIGAALACFPGISRIGTSMCASAVCGADRRHALNWALLMSIPGLCMLTILDVLTMIQLGVGILSWLVFAGYILSAVSAFVGAYFGVMMMRIWVLRSGFSGFAYGSWGMAIFTFVLYLIV